METGGGGSVSEPRVLVGTAAVKSINRIFGGNK